MYTICLLYTSSKAKPIHEFSENMIKVTLPVITSGGDLTGDEKIIYDSMDRLGKTSSQIAKAAGFGKNKTLKLLGCLLYTSESMITPLIFRI